jgi:NitT/TauT family transport system permease protein
MTTTLQPPTTSEAALLPPAPSRRGPRKPASRRLAVFGGQIALLALILGAWQFLPQIPWLRSLSHVFDPYFVSSPVRIGTTIFNLATGSDNSVLIWPYMGQTVFASMVGTIIGLSLGALCGLILSNFAFLSAVMRPFIVAANATPRVALIPVVVIIFGLSLTTSIVIAVLVVFFVAFFNAYEGGTSIPPQIVQNARLLGANNVRLLFRVRLQYALAWTITGLPLAVTFAIISVVTGEILTGYQGTGYLLSTAATTGNASLTFGVVFYLAVIGLLIVMGAEAIRRRVLHWWAR